MYAVRFFTGLAFAGGNDAIQLARSVNESAAAIKKFMIEYPFDSTRMVVNLINSGTFERNPDMKINVAHGGGTIPFLAPRMASIMSVTEGIATSGQRYQKIMELFKSLYFDLTAVTHPGALGAIKTLMPSTNLLMGFDFPFMPAMSIAPALKDFYAFEHFTNEDHIAIENGNSLSLFKKLFRKVFF